MSLAAAPATAASRISPARLAAMLWVTLATVAIVATVVSQPNWWEWVAPEASLAREINTAMLLATAGAALMILRRGGTFVAAHRMRLVLLAAGFFYLAVDERVAIHERLRDRVLAPRDIRLPFVPWGEPGDIVLIVVGLCGLGLLPYLLPLFRSQRRAFGFLVVGLVLSVAAVGLDTLPIEGYTLRAEIWFQSIEELIELAAACAFLSAMIFLVYRARPERGPAA